jgi:hypothetical protein
MAITGHSIFASSDPAPGLASISPAFDDDFLWHRQDTFHDAFCHDLDDTESLVMATNPEAARTSLFRRCHRGAGVEHQAKLVSGLGPRPNDPAADPAEDG